MKDNLYHLANGGDTWTPAKGYRHIKPPPKPPVVARESVLSLADRKALIRAAKKAREAAERAALAQTQAALARRKAAIRALESARIRAARERAEAARLAQIDYVESVKEATLGKLSMIVCEVAAEFGLRRDELRSESRQGQYMAPRGKAAWRMWDECRPSFAQIGRALCRDHSSIIHLIALYAGPRGLDMPPACRNRYERVLFLKKKRADQWLEAAE